MLSTSEGQRQSNEGWLAGTAIEPVCGIGLSFPIALDLPCKHSFAQEAKSQIKHKYIFLI